MRMDFKVTYADGRVVEVTAMPKDIVAFERQYGRSFAAFADKENPPQMEWMYYLAWSPLHRLRKEPVSFDEFLDLVEEIEPVDEVAESDPTQPAASVDELRGSPSVPA